MLLTLPRILLSRIPENSVKAKFSIVPLREGQDRGRRQQKSRAALGGGDSEGARLDD